MRKYLLLHCKRIWKILPFVIVVTAILFGSLSAAFTVAQKLDEDSGANMKFKIGVVGTAGDTYLEMGLAAFQSMDTTRFSVELLPMTLEEAQQAMQRRQVTAYVLFPEGFMEAAMRGEMMPLQYVSTAGAVGIVTMVKDEITQMIESIIYEAQRGAYGVGNAMWGNGFGEDAGDKINEMVIEYVELILARGKLYSTRELGMGNGLDMSGYLLTGLCVLFLLLICMPYAPMMIREDRSMERILASRGIGVGKQIAAEFAVYFASLTVLVAGAAALLLSTGLLSRYSITLSAAFQVLPVLLVVASMSSLCYEVSRNLIGGVLLQFFSMLFMAFVCGCMYPAYFFPETLQIVGQYLPAGAARVLLANCITGGDTAGWAWLLLGYSAVFLLLTAAVRLYAVRSDRR